VRQLEKVGVKLALKLHESLFKDTAKPNAFFANDGHFSAKLICLVGMGRYISTQIIQLSGFQANEQNKDSCCTVSYRYPNILNCITTANLTNMLT
jgi:hypothetical protein